MADKNIKAILNVVAAKEISCIKAGVSNTLVRLTAGPENVEKPDVAGMEKNYSTSMGVMDMTQCEVPTSATLRKALKTLDIDHAHGLSAK